MDVVYHGVQRIEPLCLKEMGKELEDNEKEGLVYEIFDIPLNVMEEDALNCLRMEETTDKISPLASFCFYAKKSD